MKQLTILSTALLLVCVLSGCAGLALLTSLFSLGELYGQVTDLFGRDSSDYTVYLDGYDTGIHPAANGRLNLNGLPVGQWVLTLASSDERIGFTVNATIAQNVPFNLGSQTPIHGAVLTGRVERLSDSGRVPVPGARVAAVFGGAAAVSLGNAATSLPTGSGRQVLVTFADERGNYRLGPAPYGDWVVTTAAPGHYADAAFATVASGLDAGNVNLLLNPDPAAQTPATVQGTVSRQGGAALPGALVNGLLLTPFAPAVDPDTAAALQTQAGTALMPQPWFAWQTQATETGAAGQYSLPLPPGPLSLFAFKFGYNARSSELSPAAGSAQTLDFALTGR